MLRQFALRHLNMYGVGLSQMLPGLEEETG
jgi:hypothetical protein